MLSLGLVYVLTSSILFAVAVVVHFHSSALSLPISPVITVLSAILPIAGFINAFVYPSLLYTSHHDITNPRSATARLRELIPFALQTLQALVTAVLATLLFESAVPSVGLSCVLENRWMGMFRAHDAGSIRQIQDLLECCGLNSVKDRAYPFPQDGGQPSACAETYGRSVACREPWTAAMRSNAGIDLGVILAAGLLQVFGLLMMREGTNWWTSWRTRGWQRDMGERESSRPLLTAEADEVEDGEEDRGENSGTGNRLYGTTNDEETASRVLPSAINEPNAWAE